ncbi:MAG: B12-binding domain-containing radical SAM protein [Deltaproteobacteria bacterium]|nr:B12-binding domain-containing radical SAM protein [Deltaproteobacteria bacterium]
MAEEIEEMSAQSGATQRVLLIKSCSNDPSWKQVNHPVGLMSIAAYLRALYQLDVRIEDLRISGDDRFGLEAVVRQYAPDIVGISALTFESNAIVWIAESVKRVNPNVPVILGGPHATAYPEKAIEIPGVDYVVVGEGEVVAGQLIDCLRAGRDVSEVKGIVYKREGRTISTGRGEYISDLDRLPMPAYDLISIDEYGKYYRMSRTGSGNFMSIFSSRGCPYRCIYCHNIFGKVFRPRSAEAIFSEIKHLYDKYNIKDFEILDDIFNLDRDRLIEFCDRIIASGMRVTFAFPNGMRGDILDKQQLSKLRQAGTIYIAFAIETGSPRLQKLIKKNIKLDKIKQNIAIAHSLKIHPHGFFMIGFPGETSQEMEMTIDFMVTSKLHTIALFVVMPFEGTELGKMTVEMGKVPVNDFSMSYHTKEFVNLTAVPDEEVNRIRRRALIKFYMNPLRLFVLARDFPSKRELGKLALLFLRRLRWRSL